jgi:hypothetical protein
MTKQDPWFFRERAVAFASLALTRHKDVKVQPSAGADTGMDLLVEILKDGKPTLRFFGVQLVSCLDLPPVGEADEQLQSHRSGDPSHTALPICAFVIGVRKPEGIYRWIAEPVVTDGRALLHRDSEGSWQALDESGVAHLLRQVNTWADALHEDARPKARGRHAKAES